MHEGACTLRLTTVVNYMKYCMVCYIIVYCTYCTYILYTRQRRVNQENLPQVLHGGGEGGGHDLWLDLVGVRRNSSLLKEQFFQKLCWLQEQFIRNS